MLSEFAAEPTASTGPDVPARPQEQLRQAEPIFSPVSFDVGAACAYGRMIAAAVAAKLNAPDARSLELLIAATALAQELRLHTRNPTDFAGLESPIEVHIV